MTDFNFTFDTDTPVGTDAPSVIDDRIRETKDAIQERMDVDHYWEKTGSQVSDTATGQHRQIEFVEPRDTPTKATDKIWIYPKDVDGKVELFVFDEDGHDMQLTTAGSIKKTSIEDFQFLPIGLISPYGADSAPSGWLICDGSAISRTTYSDLFDVIGVSHGVGNGTTTFNIPDLVGYFVRGLDKTASVDPDARSFASVQQDGIEKHYHNVKSGTFGDSSLGQYVQRGDASEEETTLTNKSSGPFDVSDDSYIGKTETRPKNVALNYIIKT